MITTQLVAELISVEVVLVEAVVVAVVDFRKLTS